jgi:hypothetical protein
MELISEMQLRISRNDLYRIIDRYSLEQLVDILIAGRYLQSDFHDSVEKIKYGHMHLYRKILRDFNPQTKTVLLSKVGSRRLLQNLDEPDKQFTLEELYCENWMLRPKTHFLF